MMSFYLNPYNITIPIACWIDLKLEIVIRLFVRV